MSRLTSSVRARLVGAVLPAALLLLLAGTRVALSEEVGSPKPLTATELLLVSGNRAFACDLLKAVAGKAGNTFFSPHSIASALAMARAGAVGETATQMDAVLHLPPKSPAAYRGLVSALTRIRSLAEHTESGPKPAPAYALAIANGLFVQKGYPLLEPFRKTVADDFRAELKDLDFTKGPTARDAINGWVAKKTNDRIKDIVPPTLPTPDTRLVLANAIHFKAQWEEAFSEHTTVYGPFSVAPGKEVTARRMKRTDHMMYAETPAAQWVEIPYRGGDTSMVVVLPKAKDGIDALVASMTGDELAKSVTSLESRRVALELPKFTFTSTLDLAAALESLGMTAAFDLSKADFTGISQEKLFIGAVLHKAFVAVDEKGTEAAAATVVMMAPTSAAGGRPQEPVPFVVDHPFLFFVRHTVTGEILFLGRVQDPTAGP